MVQFVTLLSAFSGLATLVAGQGFQPGAPCHVASTRLHIDALYAKTPAAAARIPLTSNVVRSEGRAGQSVVTARNAAELRRSIYSPVAPFFLLGKGPDGLDIGPIVSTVVVAAWNGTLRGSPEGVNGTRVIQYTTFLTDTSCEISQIDTVYETNE